jgi:hypothetical protein
MKATLNRRHFVITATLGPLAAAHAADAITKPTVIVEDWQKETKPPVPKDPMPMGKIGQVELCRLMLGGNLISGYSHSRDLTYVSQLMKRYNTEFRIINTLEIAESQGINAINLSIWDNVSFLQKHWKNGGKMKLIAQALPSADLDQFKKAVDMGACGVHIQGHGAEKLVEKGDLAEIRRIIEYLKSQKVLTGVAAHALSVIVECEKAGIEPDFYQKTLHSHDYPTAPRTSEAGDLGAYDNSWCKDPQAVIDFMATVKKPWIAFKVMAAGAIPPQKAFTYAFQNGADFVLAGMFDWQIAEDVNLAKEALAGIKRPRPWCG